MTTLVVGASFRDTTIHESGPFPIPIGAEIGSLPKEAHIAVRFREEWTK